MPYKLILTERYKKRSLRFLKDHPELTDKYLKTLSLLISNPFHPSLRLHALSGKHEGFHSISITMNYRIKLEFLIVNNEITPLEIGSHEEVY